MPEFEIKDSGKREEFTTGAVRDSREGKGRYDLIPVIALKRVAAVYEKGASKYTARNWEGGINQSRCYDSALRHLMQYAEGLRDEDHLAQAAFNVLAMIFTEEQVNRGNLPASLMDLPSYVPATQRADGTYIHPTCRATGRCTCKAPPGVEVKDFKCGLATEGEMKAIKEYLRILPFVDPEGCRWSSENAYKIWLEDVKT